MHIKKAKDIAIDIENLSFYYDTPKKVPIFSSFPLFKQVIQQKKIALDNVNLKIRKNKITALLGKNGSGKTSLIRLISGLRSPMEGSVTVFGKNPVEVRHRIGLCLGNTLIYHRLTARENLEYFGKLYNLKNINKKIKEISEMLQIDGVLDQMVESFSFGMKAKLAIARSIIHSPDLLILDEPTLGIDINLALQLREFIKQLKCTVLLTTHYMEEAEALADDLCFIDKGKIIDFGEKKTLYQKYHSNSVANMFNSFSPNPPSQLQEVS